MSGFDTDSALSAPARPGRRPPAAARAIVAGLLLLASSGLAAAGVTLNLEGADIGALIATVSEITGKSFIVDPRVKGKVTVVSTQPMDKDQVWQVFLSVLQTHGFSAIPSGAVVKIVPDANARQAGPFPLPRETEGEGDVVTTRVIHLEHVNASQLVPLLRPLVPQEGHLAAYPATNTLIITDRASNVRRLLDIVRRVDQASDSEVEVIRLRHASAAEIVRILTALEQKPQAGEAPRQAAVISADERTNSILVSGDPVTRLRLRTLATHLDTPLETTGNTHVIYLRYAQAKDLVSVLTGLGDQGGSADRKALAPSAGPGGAAPSLGGGAGPGVTVVAEERSNALVITAPPAQLETLRGVIRQLDIRRAQVLVEAIIAEVSPSQAARLGIQWRTGIPNVGTFGRFQTRPGSDLPNFDETDVKKLTGGLSLGYMMGGNLQAILRAVADDSNSNVLSTPTLVTMDNEEAEIIVGQNVPIVTGTFTTSTGGGGVDTPSGNPFQTFQRQDVGILLKVKPQINEGDAVRLNIKQEVSNVIPGTSGTDLQISKRSVDTKVMVDDGQILVLGGLIEDKLSESVVKVPLLGDIPILGAAFRDKQLNSTKINLMIFLKPTILRGSADGTLVSSAKYAYLRAQQEAYQPEGTWIIPGLKREVLPPWPGTEPVDPTPPAAEEPERAPAPFTFPWESP